MVSLMSLAVPILLSSVLVFFASFVIHMVLPYHWTDMRTVPREDEVMDALRRFAIPPGDYAMPCSGTPANMRKPEFIEKQTRGPVVHMTVIKAGPPSMGKNLTLWFLYSLVVGVFAAYITSRALAPGSEYLQVFRFAGTIAFLGYALALAHDSIWYQRSWATTWKYMFDGLVYGMLTAGTFGWLWPR